MQEKKTEKLKTEQTENKTKQMSKHNKTETDSQIRENKLVVVRGAEGGEDGRNK